MTTWTDGYVADITYTHGYYGELNPERARAALLDAGVAVPSAQLSCELGFGQGLSVNIHAAASATGWMGTDFNPAQAAHAQELAAVAGANARLLDSSFAEFAARSDLPDFDFIGLHGIWSWISDENRTVIVDVVRRKLKPGGVLYISYNTQPGWASFAPARHLLTEHANSMSAPGAGIVSRIDQALAFADRLMATNPTYARANPTVAERLKKLKEQNRHYLAHEYFNRSWHPMHFSELATWLEPAKVQFACSAHLLDHIPALNLTQEQQQLLAEVQEPTFRETLRDFMVNQQFRRDYWVKGLRRLSAHERLEHLRQQRVVMVSHRPDVQLKATGSLGEAALSAEVYAPLLDMMADLQVRTVGELESSLQGRGLNTAQVTQAVTVLMGAGHLAPAQAEAIVQRAGVQTRALNAHLIRQARHSNEISYLASPVTGGGIAVARFQQLFLLALSEGRAQPGDWARFTWEVLQGQGQRLIKDGKTLETVEQNLAELTEQAQAFANKQLPLLRALQIA